MQLGFLSLMVAIVSGPYYYYRLLFLLIRCSMFTVHLILSVVCLSLFLCSTSQLSTPSCQLVSFPPTSLVYFPHHHPVYTIHSLCTPFFTLDCLLLVDAVVVVVVDTVTGCRWVRSKKCLSDDNDDNLLL